MLTEFPYHQTVLHGSTPEYEDAGFAEDISDCRTDDDLPQAARDYIGFIEDFVGVPVSLWASGRARADGGPRRDGFRQALDKMLEVGSIA